MSSELSARRAHDDGGAANLEGRLVAVHRGDLHGTVAQALERAKPGAIRLDRKCVGLSQSPDHVELRFAPSSRQSSLSAPTARIRRCASTCSAR
jgi:hypothetical protein